MVKSKKDTNSPLPKILKEYMKLLTDLIKAQEQVSVLQQKQQDPVFLKF
jgi:hypothetical protein